MGFDANLLKNSLHSRDQEASWKNKLQNCRKIKKMPLTIPFLSLDLDSAARHVVLVCDSVR